LRQLWEALKESKYWGPFETALQQEDVNALQELKEAIVMFNSQPPDADISVDNKREGTKKPNCLSI
jgi:hypothetical protein